MSSATRAQTRREGRLLTEKVEEIQKAEEDVEDVVEEVEEVVEEVEGLSLVSSVLNKGHAVPVTIGLATAVLALLIFLVVFLAVMLRRPKKHGRYEVYDDRKIIKLSDNEDDDVTTTTESVEDRQQLEEIFPHLISFPRSEDTLPGPGLVGLGFK